MVTLNGPLLLGVGRREINRAASYGRAFQSRARTIIANEIDHRMLTPEIIVSRRRLCPPQSIRCRPDPRLLQQQIVDEGVREAKMISPPMRCGLQSSERFRASSNEAVKKKLDHGGLSVAS